MSDSAVRPRRWSRVEYDDLIEKRVFRPDERLELLGGELVVSEPHGDPHTLAVELVNETLVAAFGPAWRVRVQLPVALDEESEPEPDISVAAGRARDRREPKPSRLALVVEIADSSLALDREHKGSLYARAGVPDYWIVNLVDRILEVYREPGPDATTPFGWGYRGVRRLEHVTPLVASSARILVGDLLPSPPSCMEIALPSEGQDEGRSPECYTSFLFPTLFDSRQRRLDGRRREATHAGGKSGLHRAGCWLTARGGNPTDQCHRKQTAVPATGR